MPECPTVDLALTVPDLARSVPWSEGSFDAKPALDEDADPFRHVWAVGSTSVGLHRFPDRCGGSQGVDERRVGLEHLVFVCADHAELERWEARLGELAIEHGGIVDAGYGSGSCFRDPDNTALEFIAPPSR